MTGRPHRSRTTWQAISPLPIRQAQGTLSGIEGWEGGGPSFRYLLGVLALGACRILGFVLLLVDKQESRLF